MARENAARRRADRVTAIRFPEESELNSISSSEWSPQRKMVARPKESSATAVILALKAGFVNDSYLLNGYRCRIPHSISIFRSSVAKCRISGPPSGLRSVQYVESGGINVSRPMVTTVGADSETASLTSRKRLATIERYVDINLRNRNGYAIQRIRQSTRSENSKGRTGRMAGMHQPVRRSLAGVCS